MRAPRRTILPAVKLILAGLVVLGAGLTIAAAAGLDLDSAASSHPAARIVALALSGGGAMVAGGMCVGVLSLMLRE
jgi:hypothetical protein